MSGSRSEARRRKKNTGKSRFYKVVAAILIVAGLGVLSYAGGQRLLVNYNQAKLRSDFEATAGFSHLVQKPQDVAITEWQPMRLVIPTIEVDLVAVGGGDVFDKALLDQGPTHFQMSDLPNTEKGNVAFAGHRAGRWNFFLDLDQLNEGDEIFLDVAGYRFIYLVEWVDIFSKYDWSPIDSTDYPAITLQTCEPKHVSNPEYRLMVRGALSEVILLSVEAPPAN
ncbi:MAG: class E sortase [Dethiobacteria bacterium]|nr:class E sortase [Dethiobacteria bacterium]